MSKVPEKICDVDGELVVKFLALVRDNYRKADEASFFLEYKTGKVNIHSIANLRDVLSHLATLLSPDTPDEKRVEQLANAEEHLRRAIIEPYETALNRLTVNFEKLYGQYKERVVPVSGRHADLSGAPDIASIEARLADIMKDTSNGRIAKAKNLWDPEWEAGVAGFIDGYQKLFSLSAELEEYYHRAGQIIREENHQAELTSLKKKVDDLSKRSTRATAWGIVATVLVGVLGVAVSVVSLMLFRSQ